MKHSPVFRIWEAGVVLMLLSGLAACAQGNAPRQIASYSDDGPRPISIAPAQVVYNASIELEVEDVEHAAERADGLAYRHGGYMAGSRSWQQDGKSYTSLTLAVPVPNFDALHGAVLDLGTLKDETVSGQLLSYGPGGQTNYSQITILFIPASPRWPSLPSSGWNPGRTLESAFHVFAAIFGFVVDVLIWVLVVVGPFVLIGWGAWALLRRLRR